MITLDQLKQLMPLNKELEQWYPLLVKYMTNFDITSKDRIAMFLAQCAHESNQLTVLKENLNYSAQGLLKIFPKYFDASTANQYHRNPEKIANRVYANRMQNGDEASGDGWKFRGRGIIQLTGKLNYKSFADFLEISIDDCIKYLETKEGALHSACWFWQENQLNKFADVKDIVGATKRINGGKHGLNERIKYCEDCLVILK